jgi:hypothetical protein
MPAYLIADIDVLLLPDDRARAPLRDEYANQDIP